MSRPYSDEFIYALVGHQWLQGVPPYTAFWDVKPPGLFGLYALAEILLGDASLGTRVLPLLANFATALAIWRIGIEWTGDRTAALIAGLLYSPYTLLLYGTLGPAVLLMQPFVAFGLLAASRRGACAGLVAGALLGLAGTIKQVAIFEALLGFVMVVAVNRPRRPGEALPVVLFILGGLAPTAAFCGYFAVVGEFRAFFDAVFLSALRRSEGEGISFLHGLWRFLPMNRQLLPLVILCGLAVIHREWFRGREGTSPGWIVAWFVAAAAAILMLRSAYEQYFLTLVPPLALGAGLFLAEFHRRFIRRRVARASAVLLLGAFPFAAVSHAGEWPTDDRDVKAVVARLNELALVRGTDRPELFVADHEISIYLLTDTRQPTRFAFPQHLQCNFPLPPGVEPAAELGRVMDLRPRFVVITYWRQRRLCTRADRMAIIGQRLAAEYHLVGRVGDPRNPVDIYERN